MKLMVGMGSIDDYPMLAEAGADEIFVGYVPYSWTETQGVRVPLNRREVLYYNVQIGSYSELLILRDMVSEYHVPVTIVFNSLSYEEQAYPEILEIIRECTQAGFIRFIIADSKLLDFLHDCRKKLELELVVSGEYGELNQVILSIFDKMEIHRVIFPRQTTISEMKELISMYPNMEYEAFVLNEKCHYTGAYCNSMHCDEFCHMCKVPYVFKNQTGADAREQLSEQSELSKLSEFPDEMEQEFPGATGCGLCALWELRDAGVTHLKIVSRGNGSEATRDDVWMVKKALELLGEAQTKEAFIKILKATVFPQGCSGNCYYYRECK